MKAERGSGECLNCQLGDTGMRITLEYLAKIKELFFCHKCWMLLRRTTDKISL